MNKLIETSLNFARKQYLAYDFEKEQINSLLELAERDLRKNFVKIETLLDARDYDALDDALHATIGLLLHLGNYEAAEKLTKHECALDNVQALVAIRALLAE